MKNSTLLSLILLVLTSCGTNQNSEKKVDSLSETERLEIIFEEFKALHKELQTFKSSADFKTNGFGAGGSNNAWLEKVQELKDNPDSKLLLKKGIVAGELEQLGLAYASSKGQETEITKTFTKIFEEAIDSKSVEKVETKTGNANYDKIKSEYELLGKWTITNTTVNQSYAFEIYKEGNEYVSVIPQGDFKTEILSKKGNDYYVKGNKYGEFYRIDSDRNMKLFDKDGDLSSMGYKAIKR
ncbi:hypothetical protein QYS49_25290 [Marivirga salinae]|uniref:Lipoprotein n=1 Tax=Marivirga salinarum TaxID=3059078 RepID=A0AA49GGC6_9BACT|nr:hypothetical protein [Marivirga sp. BDSF4-3]WKK74942.1 hypothetical protein QYS49_25290 [Marivirga sp. BDSF4-3]